jgi:hypothetical protein
VGVASIGLPLVIHPLYAPSIEYRHVLPVHENVYVPLSLEARFHATYNQKLVPEAIAATSVNPAGYVTAAEFCLYNMKSKISLLASPDGAA